MRATESIPELVDWFFIAILQMPTTSSRCHVEAHVTFVFDFSGLDGDASTMPCHTITTLDNINVGNLVAS